MNLVSQVQGGKRDDFLTSVIFMTSDRRQLNYFLYPNGRDELWAEVNGKTHLYHTRSAIKQCRRVLKQNATVEDCESKQQ